MWHLLLKALALIGDVSSDVAMGPDAVIEVTGLRNPCRQIDSNIAKGAMAAPLGHAPNGDLIRKAGVMAVVIRDGEVTPGDAISVLEMPAQQLPLAPV